MKKLNITKDDKMYDNHSDDILWKEYFDAIGEAIHKLQDGVRSLEKIEAMNVPYNSKRAGQMMRKVANIQATLRDELA